MPLVVIATTEDLKQSSNQTLIQANNYTDITIPEQIQEVLLPLLPASPTEVSNVTWDFQATTADSEGNELTKWESAPTIEYVDQSANISLDICKTLVSAAKAQAITDSNAYTDTAIEGILDRSYIYTDNRAQITLNNANQFTLNNINLLKDVINSIQISQYLTEEDIMDAMDRIDLL